MRGTGKTAEQLHYELASKPCTVCRKPGKIRIRTLAQLAEVIKQAPEIVAAAAAGCEGGMVPTIPTKYGPMVCLTEVWACERCQKDAEKASAKHPSWVIVEVNYGPGPDKLQIQVPR